MDDVGGLMELTQGWDRNQLARGINSLVERLAESPLEDCSIEQLDQLVIVNENTARKLYAAQLDEYRAAEASAVGEQVLGRDHVHHRRFNGYLADRLTLTAGQARRRVRHAHMVSVPPAENGDPVRPAACPCAAFELHAGAITPEHLDILDRFSDQLPERLAAEPDLWERMESLIVGFAAGSPGSDGEETAPPQTSLACSRLATELLERLDPDGRYVAESDRQRRRRLTVGKPDVDGMSRIGGWLHPQLRELLMVVLEKYGAPGVEDPFRDRFNFGDDDRTSGQRDHDALLVGIRELLCGGIGTHRGLPAVLIATATLGQILSLSGQADTATGGKIPVDQALRLAGGELITVITDHRRRPLRIGRARIANIWQRYGLIVRDHHCRWINCTQPPSRCEVHHVYDWAKGGLTNIETLALLCDRHHALLGDDPGQWWTELDSHGNIRFLKRPDAARPSNTKPPNTDDPGPGGPEPNSASPPSAA